MAQVQDLSGLLTGISSRVNLTPMQALRARGYEANQGLRKAAGGLMSTIAGKEVDVSTTREKVMKALSKLDINNPEDRPQIYELVGRIDPSKVPALRDLASQKDLARTQQEASNKMQQDRIDLETRRATISETQGEERLEIERERLKGTAHKMTDADRERIADAENAAGTFGNASRSATTQALRYETEKPAGGVRATAFETFNNFFGTQDDVSAMRTAFKEVVNTNIINSLPPGVASDKDIAMAMSGFPNENWSHTQVSKWLRGRAKLTAFAAEKEKLKSKYLNDNNGNLSGFTDMWDNLRKSDGYKETVEQTYNLPSYDIPAEPVSFDQAVFDSLLEKNKSRPPTGRNARNVPKAKVEGL